MFVKMHCEQRCTVGPLLYVRTCFPIQHNFMYITDSLGPANFDIHDVTVI